MTEGDAPDSEFVRIAVSLEREPGDVGPEDEWVWAEPLGAGRFRIETPPFFAYGLSHGDVVRADPGREMPRFAGVERKSGHRTMRMALDPDRDPEHAEVRGLVAALEGLGCAIERLPPKLFALDVPPEVDVAEVVRRLQGALEQGALIWEWADPRPS
jgi:hypothetical protein